MIRRELVALLGGMPLQSSLMSKTYLKSDHFNGGGSILRLKSEPRRLKGDSKPRVQHGETAQTCRCRFKLCPEMDSPIPKFPALENSGSNDMRSR
jgi:hypothetical protein